jgi:hypothetical protein
MNRYRACPACSRHVKASERQCPFCQATTSSGGAPPSPSRTNRARWLAYGSTLAVAGCTGAGATGSTGGPDATAAIEGGGEDARVPDDAIASESSDAAAAIEGGGEDARVPDDATAPDSSDAAEGGSGVVDASADSGSNGTGLAASDASFLCLRDGGSYPNLLSTSDVRCQTTQFCYISGGGSGLDGCWPLGPGPPDGGPTVFLSDAGCKDGTATCACVVLACGNSPSSCTDDDGGGVTVSCGTCYGAPPARLEANWDGRLSREEHDVLKFDAQGAHLHDSRG